MRSAGYRDFPGGPGSSPHGAVSEASNSRGKWEVGRRKNEVKDPGLGHGQYTEMHPRYNGRVEYFAARSQS